jgi:hypothetical protein
MFSRGAARDSDGTEFLMHAVEQPKGPRHQRTQRPRAESRGQSQSVAWQRLWLLFGQIVAAGHPEQEWGQELPDRTAVDD